MLPVLPDLKRDRHGIHILCIAFSALVSTEIKRLIEREFRYKISTERRTGEPLLSVYLFNEATTC